ncbi:MAG: formate dehydrogenase accessory protein FdhE [Vicinamibacterales bacterium]
MPYAEVPPVDHLTCLDLANRRWEGMLQVKPELGPAVALQRRLIGVVADLTATLAAGRPPRLSLPARYVTTKLRSGIPALTGEPVPVPVEQLRPALNGLVTALADGGGGEATRLIRVALDEGKVDAGALLTLTLRREQALLRSFATKAGLGHDLLWLVCDLAVGPFAHALLQTVLGDAPPGSPLRAALDEWSRGYCPHCGSWPAYAEHRGTCRRLRCSFCAAAWDLPFGSCVYCGAADAAPASVVPDDRRPARGVESCTSCRGYIKLVDEPASLPFPLLPLVDLDSMDLDILAMQRGAARPAIRQFARR